MTMTLLISGLSLFIISHLALVIKPDLKVKLDKANSVKHWRTIFSIVVLISMLMIIFGWRSTPVEYTYVPPAWTRHLTMLIMLFAIISFGASKGKTDLQRLIRNPMMTGVSLWAFAHLLANGETRSLLLFGSFFIWINIQAIFANRRDGAWVKPEPVPKTRTLRNIIISIIMYLVIFFLHKYITGISLIPAG